MTHPIRRRSRPWTGGPLDTALRTVSDRPAVLGECPLWWPERATQFWVDIRGRSIWALALKDNTLTEWAMPELTGGICLTSDDRLLVGLESRLVLFDPVRSRLDASWTVRHWRAGMRFNEIRCDPWGRLWAGYMDDRTRAPYGGLFRLTGDGLIQLVDEVAVPNSLAWSADQHVMYFADGRSPVIWRYDIEPGTARIGNRRPFHTLALGSVPDGATVDRAGFLWSATYGAGSVVRYDPDGAVDLRLELPVSQPTSCEFGGPQLDLLFITSASQRLSEQQLAAQPLAGHTFAIRLPVPGLATPGLPTPRVDMAELGGLDTATEV